MCVSTMCCALFQALLAGATYVAYGIDTEGHTHAREGGSPLNQTIPLWKSFKRVLQDMHTAYRYMYMEIHVYSMYMYELDALALQWNL